MVKVVTVRTLILHIYIYTVCSIYIHSLFHVIFTKCLYGNIYCQIFSHKLCCTYACIYILYSFMWWCTVCLTSAGPRLEQLMEQLRSDLSTNPPLPGTFTPKKGALCVALFTDGLWWVCKTSPVHVTKAVCGTWSNQLVSFLFALVFKLLTEWMAS